MTFGARFSTDIDATWGHWPGTPPVWSYSSLSDIEECPRRWMLARATYPDLWDRSGYPPLPVLAAVFGNVVHGVIERLGYALAEAGVETVTPGAVVSVLGDLGGWRGIVVSEIEHQLSAFNDNPRASADRVERIREELLRRVPHATDQVKIFLRRGALPARQTAGLPARGKQAQGSHERQPLEIGIHIEQEVRSEELRLAGRIDRLAIDESDITITDYKTGHESETHEEQVRLYALLWEQDTAINPDHKQATRLEIAYPSATRSLGRLRIEDAHALLVTTTNRIASADSITKEKDPKAIPRHESYQFCQVRHMCGAYWATIPPAISTVSTDVWFDFEGRVLEKQGVRSWNVESTEGAHVLVRTVEPNTGFPLGGRVRLLGIRRTIDPDDETRLVVSMVKTSEWYSISPRLGIRSTTR